MAGSARALGACKVLCRHLAVGHLLCGLSVVFIQRNSAIKLLCNDVGLNWYNCAVHNFTN